MAGDTTSSYPLATAGISALDAKPPISKTLLPSADRHSARKAGPARNPAISGTCFAFARSARLPATATRAA